LNTMIEHLDQYERGIIALGDLLSGVDALFSLLEGMQQEWTEHFRYQWGSLEMINAIAMDRGQAHLSVDDQRIVNEAIANMRRMLRQSKCAG
jgi:hypothetical protein